MEEYSRAILRVAVAQICQTIGWHSVNLTPLEFMIDLLQEYIQHVSHFSHQFSETLGRTEVNLDDVGFSFQVMNINLSELLEYVRNVESVPCALKIPKLPIFRENHLNFLKPGSNEVVTRAVHIPEHLPPMLFKNGGVLAIENNRLSQSEYLDQSQLEESDENPINSVLAQLPTELVFKRPHDPSSDSYNINKRIKMIDDSRPLREIHSVMMTTSGFLSPAREGKLPESRTPVQARNTSPPADSDVIICDSKSDKKIRKNVKKNIDDKKFDKENKKKNREKELIKFENVFDKKVNKKLGGSKELIKSETLKPVTSVTLDPFMSTSLSTAQTFSSKEDPATKLVKNLSPKRKNLHVLSDTSREIDNNVGKLPVEPDKQKINILKKISKPREEKLIDHPESNKMKNSHEISSDLSNIDVDKNIQEKRYEEENANTPQTPDVNVFGDIELVEFQSPSSDVYLFDDISSPGTPSTPKTPEMSVPGITEQKKKRKDRNNKKKENIKHLNSREIHKNKTNDAVSSEMLERPKTPEAVENILQKDSSAPTVLPFPFFSPFPPTPGLIPPPINHPMFQRFPLPSSRNHSTLSLMNQNPSPLSPFLPSNERADNFSGPKLKSSNCEPSISTQNKQSIDSFEESIKMNTEKINTMDTNDSFLPKNIESLVDHNNLFLSNTSSSSVTSDKMKLDKIEKKSKKHKIEKKDKFKKKKDKKEKHKDKTEKTKEKREKLERIKEKKERKDKKKEKDQNKMIEILPRITFKLGSSSKSSPPENPPMKKITIKPLPKKLEEMTRRESSPELAKISALITRPPKQKNYKIKTEQTTKKSDGKEERDVADRNPYNVVSTVVDQSGHQVWICPACGNQDDGSPMIGCDDCDAWYHWVCVGMQVPPATNEDWYCRLCIAKKQELHHDRKKRKRRKKVKVTD
ncbi:transcription initiation factor TFIID subunit 3 isoform X2 [Chelonus insularis]|uniref:transcription initiation factor TFIID subunit 3 isoform X2 n=1 Tax=Chelonus insularis TaxID=460826 RepID=UPI001589528B|nr:transcription initiation factor TFIID subunit 3-like isoform X2 [Chelonus insularis]